MEAIVQGHELWLELLPCKPKHSRAMLGKLREGVDADWHRVQGPCCHVHSNETGKC